MSVRSLPVVRASLRRVVPLVGAVAARSTARIGRAAAANPKQAKGHGYQTPTRARFSNKFRFTTLDSQSRTESNGIDIEVSRHHTVSVLNLYSI